MSSSEESSAGSCLSSGVAVDWSVYQEVSYHPLRGRAQVLEVKVEWTGVAPLRPHGGRAPGVVLSHLVRVGLVFATSSSSGIPARLCPTISEVPMSDLSATAALRWKE